MSLFENTRAKDVGNKNNEKRKVEENPVESRVLPPSVFVVSALGVFILGIAGIFAAAKSDDPTFLGISLALSIFLAPALLIYPVVRFFVGEGKPVISAIISALFGAWVQSGVKKMAQKERKY